MKILDTKGARFIFCLVPLGWLLGNNQQCVKNVRIQTFLVQIRENKDIIHPVQTIYWKPSPSALGRPYPFNFFKGRIPQILVGPFWILWLIWSLKNLICIDTHIYTHIYGLLCFYIIEIQGYEHKLSTPYTVSPCKPIT